METNGNSSRRTAASILSISTSSSRASQGYDSDVERSEKTGTRLSRRTIPSAGGMRDRSPGKDTVQANGDRVQRKREFKGRHIQMMAIGNPFSFLTNNVRRNNWGRGTFWIRRDYVSLWSCLHLHCVHFHWHDCYAVLVTPILTTLSNSDHARRNDLISSSAGRILYFGKSASQSRHCIPLASSC